MGESGVLAFESKKILRSATSDAWVRHAQAHWHLLLIDHAHCERKAAAQALRLLQQYPDYNWNEGLSRIVREEMRHYELVLTHLKRLEIKFVPLSAPRYGRSLQAAAANIDPERLIDQCLISAFIEARSCERFSRIIEVLEDEKLKQFYAKLCVAEDRHYLFFVNHSKKFATQHFIDWHERFEHIAAVEEHALAELDLPLRFHS